MNLKQFADMAGVSVKECGPGWGGRYGYVTDDAPNCMECGYKTKNSARKAWLMNTFGDKTATAVQALLTSNTGDNPPQPHE